MIGDIQGNPTVGAKSEVKSVIPEDAKMHADVKVGKPSVFKKLFASDVRTANEKITNDIILPGIRRGLCNIGKAILDVIFNGGTNNQPSSSYTNYSSYSYNRYGQPTQPQPQQNYQSIYGVSHIKILNSIIFNDYAEATDALRKMREALNTYKKVSVFTFLDILGSNNPDLKPTFEDDKWGWYNLDSAFVAQNKDGYSISFPTVTQLNR